MKTWMQVYAHIKFFVSFCWIYKYTRRLYIGLNKSWPVHSDDVDQKGKHFESRQKSGQKICL